VVEETKNRMSRHDIYYWKCDRPAAFHGTGPRPRADEVSEEEIRFALEDHFHPETLTLSPAAGQGNHLTWNAEIDGASMFLRIENGPEGDGYLEMESVILGEVAKTGVPVPRVLGCDASRTRVPFAWQALECIPFPDLNQWQKAGTLDADAVAFAIGESVAKWQGICPVGICPVGFGPFNLDAWREGRGLRGWHGGSADYFRLRLEDHLAALVTGGFLDHAQRAEIVAAIDEHSSLLEIGQGCLVHKDLALWNVLGPRDRVAAFIDFDDAISGDSMDDLSLLACFHDAGFLQQAFAGYASKREFPADHLRRFWLHLLRNIIVKAVIRLGAGYFNRDSGFFLIGSGASGVDLRRFTEDRLALALRGLREDAPLTFLDKIANRT
jgi:fructosamine-3-kinase